jgi:type II secretory pathway component HofQ
VTAGQRLLDGAVEEVGLDSVTFQGERGARQVRKLFEKGEPPPHAFGADYTGAPMSADLAMDVRTFGRLLADATGLNVVVEAGLERELRMAGRAAPWDGLLARALAEAKLGSRVKGSVLLVGQPGRLASLMPPDLPRPSGDPVSLAFRSGDMRDLARLFAHLSGREVTLPEAECADVTVYVTDVPWDEAFGWIVASCGWTCRIGADSIRVEAPHAAR